MLDSNMYISIFIYTALLLVGSFIGYYKAGSIASLVMGLAFSLFLTLFTLQYRKGKNWAGQMLLLTVLVLDCFFSWRFIKTHALLPAGLLTVLSSILLVIIYLRIKKSS
jgi:uncharacterized membrane protein (UPF0136 family)